MITAERRRHVERLLAEDKHTIREIVGITGVSYNTVLAISHGKYAPYRLTDEQRAKQKEERKISTVNECHAESAPKVRCPECGAMVYTRAGCVACRIRRGVRE
jgi:uncharacterized paraquat-inducible protein A